MDGNFTDKPTGKIHKNNGGLNKITIIINFFMELSLIRVKRVEPINVI